MLLWEAVPSSGGAGWCDWFRAKVPGGWLVSVQWDDGASLTFYPDPEHQWDPNNE